jgi:plasmid maintenance system antidote protein VapI
VHGKRRITADTALRMARYFGTTERSHLNLQGRYDLVLNFGGTRPCGRTRSGVTKRSSWC